MTRFYEIGNPGDAAKSGAIVGAGAPPLGRFMWSDKTFESDSGAALGVLGPFLASGGSSARDELERLLSSGQLELAVERFFATVLLAGLEATFADGSAGAGVGQSPTRVHASELSKREREVAALIATGRTNRSIADDLFIAPSTVERHVANILNKLGFASRTQVAAWAVAAGLASA